MSSEDQPIPEIKCPECKGEVTYNGNYYCLDAFGCGWALSTDELSAQAEKQWYAHAYANLMLSRGATPDPHVVAGILRER